jgi:hypothetical protein
VLGSGYEKDEKEKDVEHKSKKRLLLDLKSQLEAEMISKVGHINYHLINDNPCLPL